VSETNNNRYNAQEGRDAFREGYRRVFGTRDQTGVKTGKWVLTPEGLVPVGEVKKDKPKQLIRIKDDTHTFGLTRVRRDMKNTTESVGGYRSI
jgi:hypothetical protein